MLKLKVIACDVLNRELSYLSSQSSSHVDIVFLNQGLHDTPEKLKQQLQQEIDKANAGFPYNYYDTAPDYDYIIVGYGLCSNGTAGVVSSRIPMVIPKAHDCITLLLGSKEAYSSYFKDNPGTYWFSSGWIERGWQPSEKKYEIILQSYIDKYGEDNAEYLMEMEQHWMKDYKNAAYIHWDAINNTEQYRESTQKCAEYFGWNFLEFAGDDGLLKRLLRGEFNESEVLIVPPGKKVVQSFDAQVLSYE